MKKAEDEQEEEGEETENKQFQDVIANEQQENEDSDDGVMVDGGM